MEPEFPDTYLPYLRLLTTLELPKLANQIFNTALQIKGVQKSHIYEQMGKYAEQEKRWDAAYQFYTEAVLNSTASDDKSSLQENLQRIKDKKSISQKIIYHPSA